MADNILNEMNSELAQSSSVADVKPVSIPRKKKQKVDNTFDQLSQEADMLFPPAVKAEKGGDSKKKEERLELQKQIKELSERAGVKCEISPSIAVRMRTAKLHEKIAELKRLPPAGSELIEEPEPEAVDEQQFPEQEQEPTPEEEELKELPPEAFVYLPDLAHEAHKNVALIAEVVVALVVPPEKLSLKGLSEAIGQSKNSFMNLYCAMLEEHGRSQVVKTLLTPTNMFLSAHFGIISEIIANNKRAMIDK